MERLVNVLNNVGETMSPDSFQGMLAQNLMSLEKMGDVMMEQLLRNLDKKNIKSLCSVSQKYTKMCHEQRHIWEEKVGKDYPGYLFLFRDTRPVNLYTIYINGLTDEQQTILNSYKEEIVDANSINNLVPSLIKIGELNTAAEILNTFLVSTDQEEIKKVLHHALSTQPLEVILFIVKLFKIDMTKADMNLFQSLAPNDNVLFDVIDMYKWDVDNELYWKQFNIQTKLEGYGTKLTPINFDRAVLYLTKYHLQAYFFKMYVFVYNTVSNNFDLLYHLFENHKFKAEQIFSSLILKSNVEMARKFLPYVDLAVVKIKKPRENPWTPETIAFLKEIHLM
jgi:hypothetical protein